MSCSLKLLFIKLTMLVTSNKEKSSQTLRSVLKSTFEIVTDFIFIPTTVFKDYENHLSELKAKYKVTSTASVASAPTTTSKPVETGFKFGNGSASTTTAPVAPSFSFGSTDKKKDSFTFGSGSSGSTLEPAKTGFTFGSGSFGSVGGSTTTFGYS